jgi:hypothetical protein
VTRQRHCALIWTRSVLPDSPSHTLAHKPLPWSALIVPRMNSAIAGKHVVAIKPGWKRDALSSSRKGLPFPPTGFIPQVAQNLLVWCGARHARTTAARTHSDKNVQSIELPNYTVGAMTRTESSLAWPQAYSSGAPFCLRPR